VARNVEDNTYHPQGNHHGWRINMVQWEGGFQSDCFDALQSFASTLLIIAFTIDCLLVEMIFTCSLLMNTTLPNLMGQSCPSHGTGGSDKTLVYLREGLWEWCGHLSTWGLRESGMCESLGQDTGIWRYTWGWDMWESLGQSCTSHGTVWWDRTSSLGGRGGRMYGNPWDSPTYPVLGQYNPKEFCTIPWDMQDS